MRPVSLSTSTSTRWVPKLGAAPWALISARPTMGPPVLPAIPAMSASDNGSKSPTLLPAGRAWPSSHTTASIGTSQILAARRRSCVTTSRAASTAAMPVEKVVRLPPVRKL
jgi:hypothetical protein